MSITIALRGYYRKTIPSIIQYDVRKEVPLVPHFLDGALAWMCGVKMEMSCCLENKCQVDTARSLVGACSAGSRRHVCICIRVMIIILSSMVGKDHHRYSSGIDNDQPDCDCIHHSETHSQRVCRIRQSRCDSLNGAKCLLSYKMNCS